MEALAVPGGEAGPALLERVGGVLRASGLIIYPTDTLYALGGLARSGEAVRRVREAKGREPGKPLPTVAADLRQARALCGAWTPGADRLASRFWPGPLTLVLPAAPDLPEELTGGGGSVAVRVPGLALARALCALEGPLVSTSANLSGFQAPATCPEAVLAVGAWAVLALDAGPGRTEPSTVVDLSRGEPREVRRGAVSWADIQAVWSATGS